MAALVDHLSHPDLRVADVVLVDGDRYWSYLHGDASGLSGAAQPVPAATTALEAVRVAQGRPATATSRTALRRRYGPCPDLAPAPEVMQAATRILAGRTAERCRAVLDSACRLSRRHRGGRVDGEALHRAQLTLLIEHDVLVRDYLLCRAVDHPDSDALVDAVVTTALTAPEPHRAPIAATAAALLAAQGDSPVATWAMLDLAGDQSLARLVRDAVRCGLPPEDLQQVFAAALDDVVQRIQATN